VAQLLKFDGLTPQPVFLKQFNIMVEHNYWIPCKRATYLISALIEPAARILHGFLTGGTYTEFTEAIGNRYGDHHLEVVFHSQLKIMTQLMGDSCRTLPVPPTTWITTLMLNYQTPN
jgi:hypothetical protein